MPATTEELRIKYGKMETQQEYVQEILKAQLPTQTDLLLYDILLQLAAMNEKPEPKKKRT